MIGHSPHVVLQSIGRMLRKHKDKFGITVCYDLINDFSSIGTKFDLSNGESRLKYYRAEEHPVYKREIRQIENY
jgi:hypothetical protein